MDKQTRHAIIAALVKAGRRDLAQRFVTAASSEFNVMNVQVNHGEDGGNAFVDVLIEGLGSPTEGVRFEKAGTAKEAKGVAAKVLGLYAQADRDLMKLMAKSGFE